MERATAAAALWLRLLSSILGAIGFLVACDAWPQGTIAPMIPVIRSEAQPGRSSTEEGTTSTLQAVLHPVEKVKKA